MPRPPVSRYPRALTTLPLLAAVLALAACSSGPWFAPSATAQLQPTTDQRAAGTVRFVQTESGVLVEGRISGLAPNTAHGFHVHEKGDCSGGDGMAAGGHFNPTAAPHGHYGKGPHHTGDLPNVVADAQGVATLNFVSNALTLDGATSIVGHGLIVHRAPDDYATQPSGNSGPRMACAVIVRN